MPEWKSSNGKSSLLCSSSAVCSQGSVAVGSILVSTLCANSANDPRETGDKPCRLNSPDCVDRAMCLCSRHGDRSQHPGSFKRKPRRPGFRPGILSLPAFSSDVCLDHASASLGPRAPSPARRRQALGDAQEFKFQNIARASRSRRVRAPAVPVRELEWSRPRSLPGDACVPLTGS
jgi:hypothetical protein